MLKILRETRLYQYDTPTKRKCIIEWMITNPDPEPVRYVRFFTQEVLPDLKVTDSKRRLLHVLPTSLIDKKTLEQAKLNNVYPIVIRLRSEIKRDEIETIRVEYIMAYSLKEVLKCEWLMIGYTYYSEDIVPKARVEDLKDASVYFGIFAPKEYKLFIPKPETAPAYKDESSVLFRWFPVQERIALSWGFHIPSRILIWLMLGLGFGIIAPILALILYCFTGNFLAGSTLIVATIAAIIAMRAWLFYSVQLLDLLNWLYVIVFLLNVSILGYLYYSFTITSTALLN